MTNDTVHRLVGAGYSVAGYKDKGVCHYALYRRDDNGKFTAVIDTTNPEEINNMVKLILPQEE